ncbi:acyl-CoA oxidase [Tothia fuscella]|uniref:Acyl-coenzyme A oxidase n=1 Tax=Tothia fuscella TaxID=1048955 RepID=A0A9P4NUM2_9PEZI|nr:acyl-CoA oxidase [Tothia fuscella]
MSNQPTQAINEFRSNSSFDTDLMTCFIRGGPENVRNHRAAVTRVEKALGLDDSWKLPPQYGEQNRSEQLLQGINASRVMLRDQNDHGHELFHHRTYNYQLANAGAFNQSLVIFLPCLQYLASPEQAAEWIPKVRSGAITGTYAQTELGHGTFVRGLETTATYDREADEFIIHSPTTASTKFWPGSLGFASSHTVTMAQLQIDGKNHGVHAFLTQIRSLEDWKPLGGIELGDIGLKFGYNAVDNGYLRFNHFRIPRTAMLDRHAQVLPGGKYVSRGDLTAMYAIMLKLRSIIVNGVPYNLAQALTIATRYSVIRTQGLGPNGLLAIEIPILQYKSQHFRILTLIAKSYAGLLVGRNLEAEVSVYLVQLTKGDHSNSGYMHVVCAGYKAWASQLCADGADDARRLCGGQGYLAMSGLPDIVTHLHGTPTFEGENYVLWQQVFRYLFKCTQQLDSGGRIPKSMRYIADGFQEYSSGNGRSSIGLKCTAHGRDFLDPIVQLSFYRHRSLRLIFATSAKINRDTTDKEPTTAANAWNRHMMSIIDAARAHIEYTGLEAIYAQLSAIPDEYAMLRLVLDRLMNLYSLSTIINPYTTAGITFAEDGYLSFSQLEDIRGLADELLGQLYFDAVALTDAWDFSDASLASAIGCYDGDAYERLLSWTRQLPINMKANKNDGVFVPAWRGIIQPMMDGLKVEAKL